MRRSAGLHLLSALANADESESIISKVHFDRLFEEAVEGFAWHSVASKRLLTRIRRRKNDALPLIDSASLAMLGQMEMTGTIHGEG